MDGYRAGVVLALLWLTACRDVSGVRDVPKEEFDEALATALCARDVRCEVYENETACKREVRHRVIPRAGLGQKYDESLAEGRTRYDASEAGECLEKIRSGSCTEPPLSRGLVVGWRAHELSFGVTDECRFLVGTVADGDKCQSLADCGPRSFCTSIIDRYGCEGVCSPRTGKGEAYSLSTSVCAPGLFPNQRLTTCEQPVIVGEGQGCYSRMCAPGLYCADEQGELVCRRWRTEGESCTTWGSASCAWSLDCFDGACRKRGGEGADCVGVPFNDRDEFTSSLTGCQRDFFCDAELDSRGKCRRVLGEGASCRGDEECAADLYCRAAQPDTQHGSCQRRFTQPGERCESSSECVSTAGCFGNMCMTYAACGVTGP